MREALYAPGLGYYSAGAFKFGAGGDFTTAPEVSPVFGNCVARQCAQVLHSSGGEILEIGAGTGQLALDLLDTLARLNCLPQRYRLLEVSADLRERQRAMLAPHLAAGRVEIEWIDQPPTAPWQGVVIANEVLDALPVRCFEVTAGTGSERLLERVVVARQGGFGWDRIPADESVQAAITRIENSLGAQLPAGYRSEFCPELEAWLSAVLENFSNGLVLLSDYGLPRAEYYLSERNDGTLICHYQQRAHDDPFMYPGLQDISAWVDFTAVAEAADSLAFSVAAFTTQAHFLIGAGLEKAMQEFFGDTPEQQLRLASDIRTLTLPGEMGERFKFLALTRGIDLPLAGFSFKDHRGKL